MKTGGYPCEHGYYGICAQCVREERDEIRARVAELEARIAELQPMAECAAIMAVCGYFSRLRGPDAWKETGHHGGAVFADESACIGPRVPLYAGSAPVPEAQDVVKQATKYARDIVTWLHRDHYADNTAFEPFDDLLGLLSQIDNMICGWKEHPAAQAEAKVADALVQDAWTFVYEPKTNFVGAYHTRGGKQSICEITNPTYRYELGVRIAELLNTYGIGNGAMLAAKAKGE